jgi:spermidine/putrescine transport system permease protein
VSEVPAAGASSAGIVTRARGWLGNPWSRPRFLWIVGIAYVVWTLVPIVIAVLFSFNSGRSIANWQGFSTRWYVGDVSSVAQDPELRTTLLNTLRLGGMVVLISVPFGVAFAIALDRWRGKLAGASNFLVLLAFVTPEVAIGVALFLSFTQVASAVGLGTPAQVLGLSMFEMAYPIIIVRARLLSIGREFEEAAMDLGASPVTALRKVLLPMLTPAIIASAAIVFAVSIDDFVIVQLLNQDQSTQTIPIKIYGAARTGPLPSLNALASITLFISTALIALAVAFYRRRTRHERRSIALG